MVHDQIALALQDLVKQKEKLKGIKKDIRTEEKITNDQYIELKRAHKDLKDQVKSFEEEWLEGLKSDEHYGKLRELKIKTDEDIAKSTEKLFNQVSKLPQKEFQMEVELGELPVKVNITPDMRVFVNGKEEKKRV